MHKGIFLLTAVALEVLGRTVLELKRELTHQTCRTSTFLLLPPVLRSIIVSFKT